MIAYVDEVVTDKIENSLRAIKEMELFFKASCIGKKWGNRQLIDEPIIKSATKTCSNWCYQGCQHNADKQVLLK